MGRDIQILMVSDRHVSGGGMAGLGSSCRRWADERGGLLALAVRAAHVVRVEFSGEFVGSAAPRFRRVAVRGWRGSFSFGQVFRMTLPGPSDSQPGAAATTQFFPFVFAP